VAQTLQVDGGDGTYHFTDDQKTALLDIGPRLGASLDLSAVLQAAIEGAVEVSGTQTGAIYLVDGDEIYLGATTPSLADDFPEFLRRAALADHPTIADTLSQGSPLYIEDLRLRELSPAEQAVTDSRDLRTVLYVPLYAEDHPIGIFMVGSVGEVHAISQTEAALSFTLSCSIALALQNARLFHSVSRSAVELEAALQRAEENQRNLRALAARITETEEAERRRLAEEIHDRVLQPLAALKMYLDQCYHTVEVADSPLGEADVSSVGRELEPALRILSTALNETRALMLQTSPPSAGELGLAQAIEWLAEHLTSLGLVVEVAAERADVDIDPDTALLAVRVAREALYNALKHSGAHKAWVTLAADTDSVRLSVVDDGCGFDATSLERPPDSDGGFGLFGLRERVAHAGGSLRVESAPGEGTKVAVRLPRFV